MNGVQNGIIHNTELTSNPISYEVDYEQMFKVIELIKNGGNDDFNELFTKYFKLAYGKQTSIENLRIFTAFLIENINSFVNCSKNFPTKGKPLKEMEKLAVKVTQFENEYSEILYYGQRNISEDLRNEIDRILSNIVN